jgi:hypothetical protein
MRDKLKNLIDHGIKGREEIKKRDTVIDEQNEDFEQYHNQIISTREAFIFYIVHETGTSYQHAETIVNERIQEWTDQNKGRMI